MRRILYPERYQKFWRNPIKDAANTITAFVKHIHPKKVPLEALAFNRTWGLGGFCLVLLSLLAGSGILMQLTYQPIPELAYASVEYFENRFIFGKFVRSIHYLSANILAVFIFVHMMRVFFTQGFQGIRRVNWLIGLCLLFFVLLSCFTGYLLPWDQTAYWAVTIGIHMLDYVPAGDFLKTVLFSGSGISDKTLQLFFTLHTTIIPVNLIFFLIVHFWKIRKAKGVILPIFDKDAGTPKRTLVDAGSNLFLREGVAASVLIAVVLGLSVFFCAPLADMANAGLSPNPAKAPWYFAGFQELLLHFHPFFSIFIIPLLMVLLMVYLPFSRKWAVEKSGVWFISSKACRAAWTAVLAALVLTPALIVADDTILDFQNLLPTIPDIVSTGLVPFVLNACLIVAVYFSIKKIFSLSEPEAFQSIMAFLTVAFIISMAFTIFLRGSGMKLIFLGGAG